jgi:hypothetical protein
VRERLDDARHPLFVVPGLDETVATIAPAFTIGLNGRLRSSTTIALNGLPDGSTPTRRSTASRPWSSSAMPNTNGLEIDWMVKSRSVSPTS